jgi:hypothetical protein
MKPCKRICTAFAAALLLVSLAASAQGNAYVAAWLGQSQREASCEGAAITFCDNDDTGWRIAVGYAFGPYLAAELGYADLGTPAFARGPSVFPFTSASRTRVNPWDLVAVLSHHFNRFVVSGKISVYRGETETNDEAGITRGHTRDANNGVVFGLLIGLEVTRSLLIAAEWRRYADIIEDKLGADVDFAAVGLTWRF